MFFFLFKLSCANIPRVATQLPFSANPQQVSPLSGQKVIASNTSGKQSGELTDDQYNVWPLDGYKNDEQRKRQNTYINSIDKVNK